MRYEVFSSGMLRRKLVRQVNGFADSSEFIEKDYGYENRSKPGDANSSRLFDAKQGLIVLNSCIIFSKDLNNLTREIRLDWVEDFHCFD